MKLGEVQQQAIQARMGLSPAPRNATAYLQASYLMKSPVAPFTPSRRPKNFAADIEERFALRLSIVAGQITGLLVQLVQVLPASCNSRIRRWRSDAHAI